MEKKLERERVVLYLSASGTRHQNKGLWLRPTLWICRLYYLSPPPPSDDKFFDLFISTGALISAARKPGWSFITNCPESGALISSCTPRITSLLCCLAHQTQMNQLLVISLRIPVTKIWAHLKRCHLRYKLIYRSLGLVDSTQWQRLQKGISSARDSKRNRQRTQGIAKHD